MCLVCKRGGKFIVKKEKVYWKDFVEEGKFIHSMFRHHTLSYLKIFAWVRQCLHWILYGSL